MQRLRGKLRDATPGGELQGLGALWALRLRGRPGACLSCGSDATRGVTGMLNFYINDFQYLPDWSKEVARSRYRENDWPGGLLEHSDHDVQEHQRRPLG